MSESQTKLDDDDLFTEASDEMRSDITEALDDAREALPETDSLLEIEGENNNLIGVLNGLKSDLDAEKASESLAEAKKWFEMGRRADAFDGDFVEETQGRIEDLHEAVEAVETAEESATQLTDSVASLKHLL